MELSIKTCNVTIASAAVPYLSDDSFAGLVVFEEKVVRLNKQLAGVLLSLGHPLLPQQHRVAGVGLGVELLLRAAHAHERERERVERRRLNKT